MRVLCLDIEGGYGGSSRSLFERVKHLHRDAGIEVWCRRDGPVQARYAELGVPCRVTPAMPHISALPRLSRNLYAFARFVQQWQGSSAFRRELANEAGARFDVVHFNHEGLFLQMRWLARNAGAACARTMHVRTHLPSTVFSRWQYRTIAATADRVAFITENERDRAQELAGREMKGEVIYNIVMPPHTSLSPDPDLVRDARFKVAVLSNFAWVRGIDRLVDVARVLAEQGRGDIVFVVAGDMSLARSLPGELGAVARSGGTLADYAEAGGVASMFRFLGHVADPVPVLAACDALAKPTREYNPWGRDIIEAMALGKPPVSVGTYDRFIEHGKTGILTAEFEASEWAREIACLADDRDRCAVMGRSAARRVAKLCSGPDRARDLLALWQSALDEVKA